MKYFVTSNDRTLEIEVTERLGELSVSVDGQPVDVDYTDVDGLGQVSLLAEGRTYGISIQGDANRCVATVAGHVHELEIEDEREQAAHAAERERAGGGGTVESVMPGVVVSVLVESGERVTAGQSLLVLEAMKMQNEIAAPSDGTVAAIHVNEGDAVAGGAKLVTLKGDD